MYPKIAKRGIEVLTPFQITKQPHFCFINVSPPNHVDVMILECGTPQPQYEHLL